MGILISQLTAETLIIQRNDLEANIMSINDAQMRLTATVNELVNTGMDLDPDSAEYKLLKQRQERLDLINKQLDQTLKRYQTMLELVDKRIEAVDKRLDKDIESMYK